jgi:hypothetical protein
VVSRLVQGGKGEGKQMTEDELKDFDQFEDMIDAAAKPLAEFICSDKSQRARAAFGLAVAPAIEPLIAALRAERRRAEVAEARLEHAMACQELERSGAWLRRVTSEGHHSEAAIDLAWAKHKEAGDRAHAAWCKRVDLGCAND